MISRYKRPDRKNAMSILEAARKEMDFTMSINVSKESASTIIRNTHECFRKLGDALMVSRGTISEDHVSPIKELMKLNVNSKRPLALLDSVRRLRHSVNYYGYRPSLIEVEDVLSIAENCFRPLYGVILKEIKSA